MTSFSAIADATETVLGVLRDGIAEREEEVPFSQDQVVLASPDDLSGESDAALSVFPYKITREPRGRPGRVQTGEETFKDPPLILTVKYLVTAHAVGSADIATSRQRQQSALGLAMQVLHDNETPETLAGSLKGTESFTIKMYSEANEDIERIWETFVDASIQPAAIYEAGPVPIESTREEEVTRVSERDVDVDRKRE